MGLASIARAGPTQYVELSDGTEIAVNIRMPDNFVEGERYPVILEISGYDSGSADGSTPTGDIEDAIGAPAGVLPLTAGSRDPARTISRFNANYVTVTANLRGTGCSTGEFDLFSWQSALDGRELIEWLADTDRPWSNGKVGIYGHSYAGISGFMVAATRPPSLEAVTVSGLIADLYRSVNYPGGVPNTGVNIGWTYGIRPAFDIGGGIAGGVFDEAQQGRTTCLQNQTGKSYAVTRDPLLNGNVVTGRLDSQWYASRSARTYAERIEVPTHLTGSAHDRQVNPHSAPLLFDFLSPEVPRRLVYMNGGHPTQDQPDFIRDERLAWMDYWMRGERMPGWTAELPPRRLGDPETRPSGADRHPHIATSKVFLEVVENDPLSTANGWFESDGFPFGETEWRELYLRAGGEAGFVPPKAGEGGTTYVSGTKRQAYAGRNAGRSTAGELTAVDGPDEAEFKTKPFLEDHVVVGPVKATLYLSTTAPDTDVQVQLLDQGPDGTLQWLNRGFLRASHRAVDESRSFFTRDGRIYRPWHPHTNEALLRPGEVYELDIEVYPVSHVIRAGHRLVVKIHSPAASDDDYAFVAGTPPSLNTIEHNGEFSSRLLLPVVPRRQIESLGEKPAPCNLVLMRCVRPVFNDGNLNPEALTLPDSRQ